MFRKKCEHMKHWQVTDPNAAVRVVWSHAAIFGSCIVVPDTLLWNRNLADFKRNGVTFL